MDNNRTNKSRRHKKSQKPFSWKIINELETTSDQDSDGTTGSIGGDRTRDSSECSSNVGDFDKKATNHVLHLADEDKPQENISNHQMKKSTEPGEVKKRKRGKHDKKLNYTHKNNEKVNSMINALLVAALLIVSGLASGHYIATHARSPVLSPRVSTTILNRYVNRTVEMYEKLIEENAELRDKIQKLEYQLGTISEHEDQVTNNRNTEQIEKDVLQGFIKFFEKEMNTVMKIMNQNDPNSLLQNHSNKDIDDSADEAYKSGDESALPTTSDGIDSWKKIPSSTDFQEQERDFNRMIRQGKSLQRRLKGKN